MTLQRFTCVLASVLLLASLSFAEEDTESEKSGISVEQKSVAPKYGILDELHTGPDELLKSDRKGAIDREKTKITIKTNVANAEIFLNGNFEGYSTLTISSLPAGRYNLRVEKTGYKTKRYRINVVSGEERVFYVELEKYEGTVNFITYPEDSSVYVDNSSLSDKIVNLEEGKHKVQVKRFGYTTETAEIYIPRNTYQIVTAKLSPAEFSMSSLRSNKKAFNPSLANSLGNIKFSFEVTCREKGTFSITDSSGEQVAFYQLPEFTTWTQNVIWDGKTPEKNAVPDGVYTATVEAGGQKLSMNFTADSSIKIQAASYTASGSGIGILPAAFANPKTTFAAGLNGGAIVKNDASSFYCAPLSLFCAYSYFDCMELCIRAGLNAGHEGASPFINSALKFVFSSKMNVCDFNWGFLLRAGGSKNEPFEPYGADNGSGAGGGIVAGLDFSSFYAGVSSEFTFGTSTYNTKDSELDKVWRNGLEVQFKAPGFSLGLYGALNSSFGTTGLEGDDRTSSSREWTRAVDAGFDLSLPFKNYVFVNLRGNAQIFKDDIYYRAEAGISTLL